MNSHKLENLHRHLSCFECPLCHRKLAYNQGNVECDQRHAFSVARQGYINFITRPLKTDYNRELFAARRALTLSGFFDPLVIEMQNLILQTFRSTRHLRILDAGCGDGTLFHRLLQALEPHFESLIAVGIDLAKEGIRTAATYSQGIYAVADLSRAPLQESQFDIVLNTLSPAQYQEFKRCLKPNGLLLKTIPGNSYLVELRDFYQKKSYRNDKVFQHFFEHFPSGGSKSLEFIQPLNPEQLHQLVQMTPLTWGDSVRSEFTANSKKITLSFELLFDQAKTNL